MWGLQFCIFEKFSGDMVLLRTMKHTMIILQQRVADTQRISGWDGERLKRKYYTPNNSNSGSENLKKEKRVGERFPKDIMEINLCIILNLYLSNCYVRVIHLFSH